MEEEGMYVRTSFTPIRMMAGQKDPVALAVEVKNRGSQSKSYSVSVKVPFAFGFDKSGLMREKRIRMAGVPPGKSRDAVFPIFGKFNVSPGSHGFEVVVREHDNRFDKVVDMQSFAAKLRVE